MSDSDRIPYSDTTIGGVDLETARRLYAAIVSQSLDAATICDEHGIITHWNHCATELYGYTAAEAVGRKPNFLVPDHLASEAEELTADARDGQPVNQFITTRQRKDGRLIETSLTISPIVSDDGRVIGTIAVARDITAMMRVRAELVESERRLNESQALAHVGSWDWDLVLEFPVWTQELCRIYGYPIDHVPTAGDIVARVHSDDYQLVMDKIAAAKAGTGNSVEYRLELPTGELRHVHARHQARRDEDGTVLEVHGVVQDVTERRHYEDELERLATHDALTGLPNRRTFDQRFELELARCRRDGIPLSLAVMDIDKFKAINDTFGHQTGDHVLARIGKIFAAQVREDELLARVGGEEFAWILHGADAQGAWIAVERARSLISAHVFDEIGSVTVSGGICTLMPGMDRETLYRSADLALLEAKRTGRDRVVIAPEALLTGSAVRS